MTAQRLNPFRRLKLPLIGTLLAIAITTMMDAAGLAAFSALPLLPLLAIFWYIERHSPREMGFVRGRLADYGLAALYPIVVMGILVAICAIAGALNLSKTNWPKVARNVALIASSTSLVAILTEEGFFRGWLWASLQKAETPKNGVLLWASIGFSLWHLSAVVLKTGFDLPSSQIPQFMLNVTLIGAVWGLLRAISGSMIVASVSHGLWNGLAYVLFGYGTKVGALGITNTALYGPEVGILGLVLNLCFFIFFRHITSKRERRDVVADDAASL